MLNDVCEKTAFICLIRSGKDISIFASGGTVYNALSAAQELEGQGISASVYNASSIKPVDNEAIKEATQSKLIFTVGGHTIMGGMGSAIVEAAAQMGPCPKIVRLGINDEFGESGTPESLYEKHGLDKAGIIKSIIQYKI